MPLVCPFILAQDKRDRVIASVESSICISEEEEWSENMYYGQGW